MQRKGGKLVVVDWWCGGNALERSALHGARWKRTALVMGRCPYNGIKSRYRFSVFFRYF